MSCDDLRALRPEWPAPPRVRALVTGRRGGVSTGPWGLAGGIAGGLNLAVHCGDDSASVAENRRRIRACVPAEPLWLDQVHGTAVVEARGEPAAGAPPTADAAVTDRPGVVLAVLTADCLPVFFADEDARVVGVAHAGWRGLSAGVLERTLEAMRAAAGPALRVHAWLGPAIGPDAFEVGGEVLEAFVAHDPGARAAFRPGAVPGKWMADLFALARLRLERAGAASVSGGGVCTVADPERFYSYRRDRVTGRFASLIWLEP